MTLREKLRLALFRKFGRSSEKLDPLQNELFGEAESDVEEATLETEDIIVPAHKRKKSGRKPLDPNIPREDVIHDISEEEKPYVMKNLILKNSWPLAKNR